MGEFNIEEEGEEEEEETQRDDFEEEESIKSIDGEDIEKAKRESKKSHVSIIEDGDKAGGDERSSVREQDEVGDEGGLKETSEDQLKTRHPDMVDISESTLKVILWSTS